MISPSTSFHPIPRARAMLFPCHDDVVELPYWPSASASGVDEALAADGQTQRAEAPIRVLVRTLACGRKPWIFVLPAGAAPSSNGQPCATVTQPPLHNAVMMASNTFAGSPPSCSVLFSLPETIASGSDILDVLGDAGAGGDEGSGGGEGASRGTLAGGSAAASQLAFSQAVAAAILKKTRQRVMTSAAGGSGAAADSFVLFPTVSCAVPPTVWSNALAPYAIAAAAAARIAAAF